MDLTPRLLTEVEFREQWRGYSPDDVDDFLERVASAVGELQDRLRDATDRAAEAERRLFERQDDDEVRRTLVLAQRTAATAMEEARAESERMRAEADEQARARLAEANERLARIEAEIDEKSRDELRALADRRSALQADVDTLAAFVEEHRARIRAELERTIAELDDRHADLAVPAPPAVSDVEVPPAEAAPAAEADGAAPADEATAGEEPGAGDGDGVDGAPGGRTGVYDALADLGGDDAVDDDDATPRPGAGASTDEGGDEPGSWPDEAVGGGGDPFLDELRRAVTDTEPLGPRDTQEVTDHPRGEDAPVPSGRFRRRRTR